MPRQLPGAWECGTFGSTRSALFKTTSETGYSKLRAWLPYILAASAYYVRSAREIVPRDVESSDRSNAFPGWSAIATSTSMDCEFVSSQEIHHIGTQNVAVP